MNTEPNEITKQNIAEWLQNKDVDKLVQAVEHQKGSIREDAISALYDIVGPKDVQAVQPLAEFLKHGEGYWPILWALDALGKIGDPGAIDVLKMYAGFSNPEMRLRAIQSLVKIGGPQTIETLKKALEDDHQEIREEASKALKKMNIN